jgi:hypothetical protein
MRFEVSRMNKADINPFETRAPAGCCHDALRTHA